MSNNPTYQIEAFFDGDCPLCVREMSMLSRLDRRGLIRRTDIASASFDPGSYGKTQHDFMQRMHGRLPDGRWVEGVEVFRHMYRAVGFGPLVALSRQPGIRQLLDWAYERFAANRLRWTGRCHDEACTVGPESDRGAA